MGVQAKDSADLGQIEKNAPMIMPSMKTGYWFRSASEHIIVGVRGKVRRPDDWPALPTWAPEAAPEGVFGLPRGPHSVKPDTFYEWAERSGAGRSLLGDVRSSSATQRAMGRVGE